MKLDHCHRAGCKQIIEALQAELMEEARLNGMGSEREAKLMARVAELENQCDKSCAGYRVGEIATRASQLEDALREALDTIEWMRGCTSPALDEVDKAIAKIEELLK